MNRRVNILQYIKAPKGWKWEAIPKNPRTGAYLWSKAQSNHFYICWREEKRRHCEKAGSMPSEALEAKRRKELELAGRAFLNKKLPKIATEGVTVDAAVEDFLEFTKNKKRASTLRRYRAVMTHFGAFFKSGTILENITADLDAYRDERLKAKGPHGNLITPRNVNYEIQTIRTFFYYLQKIRGIEIHNPAASLKKLAVTNVAVDSYEDSELDSFFQACDLEEKAVFKAFYYTGLREQELAHLHWPDVDFRRNLLKVRAKPNHGFIPKNWEERSIPMHAELAGILKALPRRHPELVFPSFRGKPNGHLLRMLYRVVDRAKLPGRWYLHKFRKTFATKALEKGADIRTVQALLGHKDITTTARYLSTSTDKMREAVGRL
jgi:integrase/recombinase XerD